MSVKSLAAILNENSSFLSLTSNNKVLCSYTKHEMPARLDTVLNHLNSKALKKAKEWYSYDYSEFLPYIVPDKSNDKKLHCKLTQMTLNKIPNEIKKHIQGKKFNRLKKEYEDRKNKSKRKKDNDDNEDDDDEADFWIPPDEDVINNDKPNKRIKQNDGDDDDEDDDNNDDDNNDDDNDSEDNNNNDDDDDDDLKYYIQKDKQKNKKKRKKR